MLTDEAVLKPLGDHAIPVVPAEPRLPSARERREAVGPSRCDRWCEGWCGGGCEGGREGGWGGGDAHGTARHGTTWHGTAWYEVA